MLVSGMRFTDNANGTVTDTGTGLVWQKCTAGLSGTGCKRGKPVEMTWQDALAYCGKLPLAGKKWRLPAIDELSGIVNFERVGPAIDMAVFPNTKNEYWSASTRMRPVMPFRDPTVFAWCVAFFSGGTGSYDKENTMMVRCVAGP